jgi:preprotein translocase subunit Sss1
MKSMEDMQNEIQEKSKSYNKIATFMTKPKENKIIMDNDD